MCARTKITGREILLQQVFWICKICLISSRYRASLFADPNFKSCCQKLSRTRRQIKKFVLFYFTKKKPFGKLLSKTIFKSSSEASSLRKIGKSKALWKLCKSRHFQNARMKKRKLIYSSSLQSLLHISQHYFQAIFYLDLGFLSISYTHAKKVMFRALLTPWISPWFQRLKHQGYTHLVVMNVVFWKEHSSCMSY